MKLFFKVVIIFLIVFNFRMGVVYNSVFLAIGLTALYYLFFWQSIPFTYFRMRHIIIILIATLLLALIFCAFTTLHEQYENLPIKRLFVQLQMLLAMVFALPLLVDDDESDALNKASVYICYAFALQGLIHLVGFLIPSFGEYMISLKPESVQEMLDNPDRNIDTFRGYALTGSLFFELPSAYGVAFILFMRLQLVEGKKYMTAYISYAVCVLIFVGIMLSGRIGFVGIIVGCFLYFLLVRDPVVILSALLKRFVIAFPVLFVVYFFALSGAQREAFEEDLFPFAFEAYYSWRDEGRISTRSSEVTMEAFYFPLRDETLLLGHGIERAEGYSFTDAGYMRTIMYGGIPLLIALLIYQYLYFYIPISIAKDDKTIRGTIDRYTFITLFVYILMLHYKDNALGLQHITESLFLLIGSAYIIQHYNSEESPISDV